MRFYLSILTLTALLLALLTPTTKAATLSLSAFNFDNLNLNFPFPWPSSQLHQQQQPLHLPVADAPPLTTTIRAGGRSDRTGEAEATGGATKEGRIGAPLAGVAAIVVAVVVL